MRLRIISLVVVAGLLLLANHFVSQSRFQASQEDAETELAYCQTMRETGQAQTPRYREICDNRRSRTYDRMNKDERLWMTANAAIGIVALIGLILILYLGRRSNASRRRDDAVD